MKALILIILVGIIFTNSYSQHTDNDNEQLRNEIGTNIISYLKIPNDVDNLFFFPYKYQIVPLSKLIYRRYLNHNIFRLSITYRQLLKSQEKPENWNSEGKYQEGLLKVGYEQQFNIKNVNNFVPYLAIDLVVIKSFAEGNAGGGATGIYNDFRIKRLGVGLSPSIGIRYNINDRLSLIIETSLDILYSNFDNEYTQTWPETSNPDYKENTTDLSLVLNPLSTFSINVKF